MGTPGEITRRSTTPLARHHVRHDPDVQVIDVRDDPLRHSQATTCGDQRTAATVPRVGQPATNEQDPFEPVTFEQDPHPNQ